MKTETQGVETIDITRRLENLMAETKYELTKDTRKIHGRILYRIKSLKSFSDVKIGDLGGWIEKESNLSHLGNCWIYDDAKIYGNAWIFENAKVYNNATIYGDAWIFGHAEVCDDAKIYGHAVVCDDAKVCETSKVYGNVRVFKNAKICGNTRIHDAECIGKSAYIDSSDSFISIENIGSRKDTTTFYFTKSKDIMVRCGCFNGTIEEFDAAVHKTHKDNPKYLNEYLSAIEFAKSVLSKND